MISFIMPTKNAANYIEEALKPFVLCNSDIEWELIIVNDHSEDNTYEVAKNYIKENARIQIYNNIGAGKIAALNYGYENANGEYFKFIDSDDILDISILNILEDNKSNVLCHNAIIINSNNEYLGDFFVNKKIINYSFDKVFENIYSIPRWSWSFPLEIAEEMFPLPADLPFEDCWFSLIIKKYANQIILNDGFLYKYRQHEDQTYGGILNFSKQIVEFRANRMIKLIDVLHDNIHKFYEDALSIEKLNKVLLFNKLQKNNASILNILFSKTTMEMKIKLFLILKLKGLAPSIIKAKWFFDNRKKLK